MGDSGAGDGEVVGLALDSDEAVAFEECSNPGRARAEEGVEDHAARLTADEATEPSHQGQRLHGSSGGVGVCTPTATFHLLKVVKEMRGHLF